MPLPMGKRYTLADALTWDEQERIELIDGYPIMQASPTRAHQRASASLITQLTNYLEGKKCEAYHAPFTVRPFERDGDYPENVDTVVEPDIQPPRQVCQIQFVPARGDSGILDRGPRG